MEVPGTARKRQQRPPALSAAKAYGALRLAAGVALAGVALCSIAACNLNNPGKDPPEGVLSFPLALALGGKNEEGGFDVLYVVNSNFDLKYNAGSVQAYDLTKINDRIEDDGCEDLSAPLRDGGMPEAGVEPSDAGSDGGMDAGLTDASVDASMPDAGLLEELPVDGGGASIFETPRGILCDGRDDPAARRCCLDDNTELLVTDGKSEILIDSYATGLEISPDFQRLYLTIRSRNTLLYLDAKPGEGLSCGKDKGRCTRGTDPKDIDLDPDADFPVQPQALTVGKLADLVPQKPDITGTFIVTAHDNGDLALLVDTGPGPKLHSVGTGLASYASSVRLNAAEGLLYSASRASGRAELYRWGVVPNNDKSNPRWLLYPSTPIKMFIAGGEDVRDLLVDEANPMRLFALMRGYVESVVFVERDPVSPSEGLVTSATRVGAGPSKLTHAKLEDRNLLFVSCFDARAIFVIDEMSREVVSVIRGLAGPFDMEVDIKRKRLYVADFRANVLRVVDVQGLSNPLEPPPRIIATLGKPSYGGKLE